MPQKVLLTALALGALLTGSVAFAQTDSASTTAPGKPLPVVFPIAALGGCDSKDACKAYCDIDANHDACFAYAQTHGLMTADAVQKARAYLQQHPVIQKIVHSAASSTIAAVLAAGPGPGGCTTQDACKTYCSDPTHSAECLQFAKDHHLMASTTIAAAQKLETAVGPGGCRGEDCKNYCDDSSHTQVCVAFAQQNGFISKDDADQRMQHLPIASTTRALLIPVTGTGTVASGTPSRGRPDIRPGTVRPPHPNAGTSTGQSSSIFFSVLHFFGL